MMKNISSITDCLACESAVVFCSIFESHAISLEITRTIIMETNSVVDMATRENLRVMGYRCLGGGRSVSRAEASSMIKRSRANAMSMEKKNPATRHPKTSLPPLFNSGKLKNILLKMATAHAAIRQMDISRKNCRLG